MGLLVHSVLYFVLLVFTSSAHAADAKPAPTLDIKPDCSERPIQIEELTAIAEKPEIETVVQFLRAIPKDAMQTFTFVPTTNSLQHHKVDEDWPRVLRMSANGKIAMSFVCNPASQDYGGVEILHFEETPIARWQSLRLHFDRREPAYGGQTERSLQSAHKSRTGSATGSARVERNSATCLNCHGIGAKRADLRPIFSSYPSWPGFFGSEDDTLFTGEREFSNFQQFKSVALKDPCFSTLPWPAAKVAGYEHYPYHALTRPNARENPYENENYIRDLKTTNYHVRPNLKFTDAFSHLLARRLTTRFSQSKDYLRVAPLLAMESLGCEGTDLDAEISKTLGRRYKKPSFIESMSMMDPRTANSRSLRLYTVGRLLGIEPDEWTLNFNKPLDPEFATGVQGAYGQDNSVARLVQSLLFEKLATSVTDLKGNFRLSRGVSEFFKGQNFACIDDLGGALEFDSIENQKLMCTALAKAHREKAGDKIQVVETKTPDVLPRSSSGDIGNVRKLLAGEIKSVSTEQFKKGAAVAQLYCIACHGSTSYLPAHYHFLTSGAALKKAAEGDPLLLFRMMAYTESGRMPMGQTITEVDRRALQQYLFKTAGEGR